MVDLINFHIYVSITPQTSSYYIYLYLKNKNLYHIYIIYIYIYIFLLLFSHYSEPDYCLFLMNWMFNIPIKA